MWTQKNFSIYYITPGFEPGLLFQLYHFIRFQKLSHMIYYNNLRANCNECLRETLVSEDRKLDKHKFFARKLDD